MPTSFVEPVTKAVLQSRRTLVCKLCAVHVHCVCEKESVLSGPSLGRRPSARYVRVRLLGSSASSSATARTRAVLPAPLEPVTSKPGADADAAPAIVTPRVASEVRTCPRSFAMC